MAGRRQMLSLNGVLIAFVLALPIESYSQSKRTESPWSFSLQTGGSVGTVSVQDESSDDSESETKKITVGGLPLILNVIRDYSNTFGLGAGGSLLFDFPNSQISQQAIFGSLYWHILGGAKEITSGRPDKDFYIISQSSRQLSLVLQGGLIRYSASNKDLSVKVTGSTFELRTGIRYRFSVSWLNAGGVELLGALLNIPADERRLESQTVEFSFFWQV